MKELLCEKHTVHVEVNLKPSPNRLDALINLLDEPLREYIRRKEPLDHNVAHKIIDIADESQLQHVDTFLLERDEPMPNTNENRQTQSKYNFRYYMPHRREMELEMFDEGAGGDGEALPSSKHWLLPSTEFLGLWENLIYEHGLKEKLLKFALSALSLSQHDVNTNIISCNRLLLLHGPPGTGKTSLCQALAQKLAIRAQRYYRHAHLIEINSHSLFSKWFSESGKLVLRLFSKIHEIIADPQNLVCVLIDEVESLAYARSAMSGQEPQDAMRVVNALLTQLDGIKTRPNVLIFATSNLADTIDLAFLDRADIKQYIGLPSVPAIRRIYESIFLELMRVGILRRVAFKDDDDTEGLLAALAERSVGISGRTLRKLPFLAHALFTTTDHFDAKEQIDLTDFLDAMLMALEKHLHDQMAMKQKNEPV